MPPDSLVRVVFSQEALRQTPDKTVSSQEVEEMPRGRPEHCCPHHPYLENR